LAIANLSLDARIARLINEFRCHGHLYADVNPLAQSAPSVPDASSFGLTESDLEAPVRSADTHLNGLSIRDLIRLLADVYCRTIGVELMHIADDKYRVWLQSRIEQFHHQSILTPELRLHILTRLTQASIFDEFVRRKFIGAKTFSLEGCDSLIPLLDVAIERAAVQDVREIVIAMAHRGRLNVLANVLDKPVSHMLSEMLHGRDADFDGPTDVKYHLGHSADRPTAVGNTIHLSLCFNPSHLEFINPVAMGRMRAKQDRTEDRARRRGMALLIHGDAAFAAQGIIQESLNLSNLRGFDIGGTLHVIVNNQIGFTTTPADGRSTRYATDVAKMLQVPIFHVNGDDPDAVASVTNLAMEYRNAFQRDVIIDLYGYRRLGHNEIDEPEYTQPLMYDAIHERPNVRDAYLQRLIRSGEVTSDEADFQAESARAVLQQSFESARAELVDVPLGSFTGIWRSYQGGTEPPDNAAGTGIEQAKLAELIRLTSRVPEGFHRHPRLERFVARREEMANGTRPLDWSTAETLALASLAVEGTPIRLCGQDSARGTFSQRHAVLHDRNNGEVYVPLQNLAPTQARVEIINSPLSEAAVLGFEYGYSLDCPEGLILWEAQYGDFCNAAQVIIDQFIVSAEQKWRRLSGLVLLLPHGFEGQGPEHSSARLERFLQLAANDNIQIAVPSTPAQMFHLLRRQVLRSWRKPLIVFTPKGLLRHPAVISPLDAFELGSFQAVIPDEQAAPSRVTQLLLCSGRVYYELVDIRAKLKRDDVAIIRIEQLYPLRESALSEALARYADGTPVQWVQEEPANMGAWTFLRNGLRVQAPLSLVAPRAASSPAGEATSHDRSHPAWLDAAFATPC